MINDRAEQLTRTATILGRSTRVLDPMRLQVWENMGIGLPQLRILFRVRFEPGIDLRTLASGLNISPSAASQQVDKLVERGLLDRSPALDDRRRLSLELTDEGREATRAISDATVEYLLLILDSFQDSELSELQRLLEKIVDIAARTPLSLPKQTASGATS